LKELSKLAMKAVERSIEKEEITEKKFAAAK
jgi:hypothetical protein